MKHGTMLVVVVGLGLIGLPAKVSAAETVESDNTIETVIVTATKREESIQDVPIAVSAITGEDLAARGVQDIYGLMEVAPSVAVYSSNSTTNGGTLRIRGVGTTGNNPGLEAAVGTFIDGIYRSRAGLAFNDMTDLDRIEILRGPQGTLFGKNTVAGAVNIVTRKPEFDNAFSVSAGLGNLESRELGLIANAVLTDDVLAGRLSVAQRQRNGFYEDIDTDAAYDNRDRRSVRAQLLWTPNADVEVRVILDDTAKDESCCPAPFWITGPTSPVVAALGGDITPFEVDDALRVGVNSEPYEAVDDSGQSVDVTWRMPQGATFRSITALRDFDVARDQDIDFTNADIAAPTDTDESFRNFSQEFQLHGETDRLAWLVGAYFYTEELVSDEIIGFAEDGATYLATIIGTPQVAPLLDGDPAGRGIPGQGYDAVFFSDTEGWSVFSHDVWKVNETMELVAGLRYSTEEKDAGAIINGAPFGESISDPFCTFVPIGSLCDNASYNNTADESKLTGTAKAVWLPTDDLRFYASYARGYKAGGFNLDQEAVGNRDADGNLVDQSHFGPETSDSLEVGVKGQYLDRRLTVNGAVFHTTFTDFQLNTFTGLGFTVGNVKEALARGVEIESSYAPRGDLYLTAGVTYTDARYGDGLVAANAHLAGKRLTQSPLWQSSVSGFFERDLPGTGWRFLANANWSYIGEVNTGSDLDPEKFRKGFGLVNAQAGVRSLDGRYEVTAWGRNLADRQMNILVFDSVFQAGSWHTWVNPPRTFGLRVRANF